MQVTAKRTIVDNGTEFRMGARFDPSDYDLRWDDNHLMKMHQKGLIEIYAPDLEALKAKLAKSSKPATKRASK